ncbi:16S rRNA (cytosine(1402)-N(4))-methyltransferase RsmH [Propionivibrio sp.]|uniref:16S rRNA (cytosine(1402)-N(4))-methyltransferase RsmH n=1 Tax=Propionivibrio sp. TaxID=2212460 RepID=UPI0025FA80D3|nr:16S rRNA (cytosine(1402)-N(4))-methyltransferase RsmH [Propionivibrio sp.]MBK7354572.1 16S rRNA (cytosine(1402)-N(4))-methyltransferase RsmH [Propionivibrio sp.]MBK8401942.1 16S rRNA (cytosine(1402)-N(4))-methyltransferase RsmH [Propionivibrio sp.]MBK8743756.1 16S rRNA (cytosine(1402)-N(4))-methyltransferase RsmH [Propionivibrio sp.]MBK8895507.1 16S rRNA (cytosine(1402)-N(4))-methyltransferase RsmH [Propionivibrio sp.]
MSGASPHQTVLLQEAVEALAINPSGTYIDGTFGYGGHSRAILERLGPDGRLLALDRDSRAVAACGINDRRFALVHHRFGDLAVVVRQAGIEVVDGVLLDIGVSSTQLDEGERGFSFRFDAPLDMRMDTTQGETAASFLANAGIKEITEVIRNYGEERFAFQIAKKIVAARSERPVATTGELAALVREAVRTREPGQDPATRTFQALRIYINQELDQLALVLPQAMDLLKCGGRLVVICFHSLEDRIVKHFMRHLASPDTLPKNLPLRSADLPPPKLRRVGKPLKAGAAELAANPRARSAVMRVAEKLAGSPAERSLARGGA